MTDHKQWLDNEYSEWIKALQESTVHNFKEHPGVRRMLGEPDMETWKDVLVGPTWVLEKVWEVERIGYTDPSWFISGRCKRYIYYAQQILKRNPSSICEIGGGVGQFFATLKALGWKGSYGIWDLPEVKEFQDKYLTEVNRVTGLETIRTEDFVWKIGEPDMLVSFYALGEFDAATRQQYEKLIDETPHGYIAWNPHSGASDSLSIFENHDIKVTPGIEPGISIIEW